MQYQSEGAVPKAIASNANMMLNVPAMTTASNHLPGTQDHLQPPMNFSSNSSSAKSIASKSTDGIGTEKKRKILSSGQQKKFHRHFKQLPLDEDVLNCKCVFSLNFWNICKWFFFKTICALFLFVDFSCAFVSDILLQGFLYITKRHIAFYSNVFGYITKLLIPIASVTRISKEKTVKIIPNAIAVATLEERHVFSSFLSREAAYRLMVAVWTETLPMCNIEVTGSSAQLVIVDAPCKNHAKNSSDGPRMSSDDTQTAPNSNTLQVHQTKTTSNSGVSELEDESSSAISGNEALSKLLQSGHLTSSQQISHDGSSSNNSNASKGELTANRDSNSDLDVTLKPSIDAAAERAATVEDIGLDTIAGAGDDGGKFKSLIAPNETPTKKSIFTLKIPRTIHVAYFALSLVIILALVAAFLFYRIAELKNANFKSLSFDELYKVNVKTSSKQKSKHLPTKC